MPTPRVGQASYELKKLCQRNADGGYAIRYARERILTTNRHSFFERIKLRFIATCACDASLRALSLILKSKKNGGVFREGLAVKYVWIETHGDIFSVSRMCRCATTQRVDATLDIADRRLL